MERGGVGVGGGSGGSFGRGGGGGGSVVGAMGVSQQQHQPPGMHYPNGYSSPGGGGSGGLGPSPSSSSSARRLAPWAGAALAALAVLALLLSSSSSSNGEGLNASSNNNNNNDPFLSPSSQNNNNQKLNGPHQSDVRLELGPYFFNPSVVRHPKGVYLATARTAHMKREGKTNWWFNEAYVCTSARPDFAAVSCRKFDPWQGKFGECLWGNARKPADVDTTGLEDAKLFYWPGKGVYAVFGRKPEALGASPYCVDPVFVQFLVQVVADGDTADAWSIKRPRELKAGAYARQLYGGKGTAAGQEPIKEKNWMPFVHQDRLFMTHSVHPHRVFEVNSSGVAVAQHLSRNDALFEPFSREDVHGGPPVVLVPAKHSSTQVDYYLGVFHFFQTFGEGSGKVKVYHHYAYKTEAKPPFRVCAVSAELSLVTRRKRRSGGGGDGGDGENGGGAEEAGGWTHQRIWKDTSQTAYVAGLALVERGGAGSKRGGRASLDVLLSYGSSDIDARLLALPLAELDAMFASPFDCSGAQLLEAVAAG